LYAKSVNIFISRSSRLRTGLSVAGPFSVVHSLDASARRRAGRLRTGKPDYSRCRVLPAPCGSRLSARHASCAIKTRIWRCHGDQPNHA
jgi:hypothetical protein